MKVKFGKTLQKAKIHEWYLMYIDYKSLKKRLKLLKRYSQQLIKIQVKFLKNEDQKYYILNYEQYDYELIQNQEDNFIKEIQREVQKVEDFYDYKYYDCFQKYLRIKEFIQILEKQQNWFKNDKEKKKIIDKNQNRLSDCIRSTYVELVYLGNYLDLNYKALKILLKKYKSIVNDFKKIGIEINEIQFNKLIEGSILKAQEPKQRLMKLKLKQYYLSMFKSVSEREKEKENLKLLSQRKILTQRQLYKLGIYVSIIFWFIVFLVNNYSINGSSNLEHKLKNVMPIFLFQFYIILYLWMISLNVYIWSKFNVNYRFIFKFNHHYSRPNQILTRACIFSTIWLTIIVFYVTFISNSAEILNKFFPFTMYLLLLGYLLFPSKIMFNGQGRTFLFKLINRVIFFCYYPSDFPINWFTDQLVSFVGPIKDLEYSICYLTYSYETQSEIHHTCSGQPFFSLLAGMIPYSLRMIQCYSQMRQKNNYKGQDFFNFLKYFVSFLTLIASFFIAYYKKNTLMTFTWILLALISTIYSYYWDLKNDWGLLQNSKQNKYLRDDLMYESKNLYYFVMMLNLILRFVWIFNITNVTQIETLDFLKNNIEPFYLNFIFCLIEMLRRIIWNLFRVEKEHVINCGHLNAVPKINFDQVIEAIPFKIQPKDQIQYQNNIQESLISNYSDPLDQINKQLKETQNNYTSLEDDDDENDDIVEEINKKQSGDILNDEFCDKIHKKKFLLVDHYIKNKPKSFIKHLNSIDQLKKLAKEDYEFTVRSTEDIKSNIQYKKKINKYD